jgi:hypothetical protein
VCVFQVCVHVYALWIDRIHKFFHSKCIIDYRKAADFCMLILYPSTLMNLFNSSNSLAFLCRKLYRLQTGYNSYLYAFSFFCLITLAKISNTLLNRSSESRHACFISDLNGNVFSVPHSVCYWHRFLICNL